MRTQPGRPDPLGAIWDGHGVNFSLFSGHATAVDLCLFDRQDATVETHRITMPERTDQVWHGYLTDLSPGQLYGYRVNGPYNPPAGHRFNAAKLLLDPYATQSLEAFTAMPAVNDTLRCLARARTLRTSRQVRSGCAGSSERSS